MRQFAECFKCIIHLSLVCGVYGFVIIKRPNSFPTPLLSQKITSSLVVLSSSTNQSGNEDISDSMKRKEWADDLNELGGDPAFLPEGFNDEDEWYDDAVEDDVDETMPSMTLLGMAGTSSILDKVSGNNDEEEEAENDEPDFEWDGIEQDDAYFD